MNVEFNQDFYRILQQIMKEFGSANGDSTFTFSSNRVYSPRLFGSGSKGGNGGGKGVPEDKKPPRFKFKDFGIRYTWNPETKECYLNLNNVPEKYQLKRVFSNYKKDRPSIKPEYSMTEICIEYIDGASIIDQVQVKDNLVMGSYYLDIKPSSKILILRFKQRTI